MHKEGLAAEHYDILRILSFAKHGGISTDLSFELHALGGQALSLSLPIFLKNLKELGLVGKRNEKFFITKKGEKVLNDYKHEGSVKRMYFKTRVGIVSMIPHSICIMGQSLMSALVPRIMITDHGRGWLRYRRMIEFKPECIFRRLRKKIKIEYGLLMETSIPRDLVRKIEESR
jgi:hypothetical protein